MGGPFTAVFIDDVPDLSDGNEKLCLQHVCPI